MENWTKGGVLGSLRKRVAREVKEHRRTNTALLSARAPMGMRLLQVFFGERGLLGFLLPYTIIVIVLLIAEVVIAKECPSIIPWWPNASNIGSLLREVTSYFLGAQVVMVGLLFPIAIALVTLIAQREDASSTISDVQVYYNETLAYRIGASGIALSIVLAAQILWPAQFIIHHFGLGSHTEIFKALLTILHLLWLILNFAALWHFLKTSLSFIRPVERALLRRRFAANVSIPQDISRRLAGALYANAGSLLLPETKASDGDSGAPSLLFGSDPGEWGEIEIADPTLSRKVLKDVWMRPLGWAVRRWWKRSTREASDDRSNHSGPTLVFAPNLECPLPEGGIICRRANGAPISKFERFVITRCFRFGKARS